MKWWLKIKKIDFFYYLLTNKYKINRFFRLLSSFQVSYKMSQQFGRAAHYQGGGIDYKKWCTQYLTLEYLKGEDLVEVFAKDGTKKEIPRRNVGVLFKDFKTMGTTIASVPLMHEGEVVYFDLIDLYASLYEKETVHPLFKQEYKFTSAIVPIGLPEKVKDNTPYMQAGRFYRSKGANTVNMSDDNVAISLFNAFSSTVYQMVNAKTETEMKSLFDLIVKLVEVMNVFNKNNKTFHGIIKQLRNTMASQDMLQYSLSFIFGKKMMTQRMLINMLYVVVKRTYKHFDNFFTKKGEQHPIVGIVATMIVAPLIRKYIGGEVSSTEMFALYYGDFTDVREKIKDVKTDDESKFFKADVEIIKRLAHVCGLPENDNGYLKLVDHANRNKMAFAPPPSTYFGIIPEIVSSLEVDCKDIFLDNGKNSTLRLPEVVFDQKDETTTKVTSVSTTQWSGIKFNKNGVYGIKIKNLGISKTAQGQTMGLDFVANMRFTFGNYVLPKDREGYAISGMYHINGKYVQKKEIPVDSKFLLELTDTHLKIHTGSYGKFTEFVKMERKYSDEYVCVGFKNMTFNLSSEPEVYLTKEKPAPAAFL